jgi:hypothetical protein
MGYMVLTYNKLIIEYNIINITEILLKVALNTTILNLILPLILNNFQQIIFFLKKYRKKDLDIPVNELM